MVWELESDRPIYLQLMEQIKLRILKGEYSAGGKLPSVRELASEASVNPNTMQRALSELERENLLKSNRTSGRYITEDEELIQQMKQEFAEKMVRDFVEKMESLGYSNEELITIIKQNKQKEEK
jgi:DNA-binding transcriptional regulator YhcF (GntR family)